MATHAKLNFDLKSLKLTKQKPLIITRQNTEKSKNKKEQKKKTINLLKHGNSSLLPLFQDGATLGQLKREKVKPQKETV